MGVDQVQGVPALAFSAEAGELDVARGDHHHALLSVDLVSVEVDVAELIERPQALDALQAALQNQRVPKPHVGEGVFGGGQLGSGGLLLHLEGGVFELVKAVGPARHVDGVLGIGALGGDAVRLHLPLINDARNRQGRDDPEDQRGRADELQQAPRLGHEDADEAADSGQNDAPGGKAGPLEGGDVREARSGELATGFCEGVEARQPGIEANEDQRDARPAGRSLAKRRARKRGACCLGHALQQEAGEQHHERGGSGRHRDEGQQLAVDRELKHEEADIHACHGSRLVERATGGEEENLVGQITEAAGNAERDEESNDAAWPRSGGADGLQALAGGLLLGCAHAGAIDRSAPGGKA